ncbi:aldehyde dehydrogenase family protein [Mangrovicoccus algicola]|uniref:Aldehyde dehydrogenase family protein n=1 Tax=Mangrovicoccus algicola TaxID=2771008 RepID=A0A8J6YQW2_9RHOB|nr:aldehyde dehydrogenase family protein [Mangrovicoccus algicola]MBE3637923.1 aldehyde dehydrogenase family protein [Mangrovicoccus algicola]
MTVREIFETMEYGPAPESAEAALAWLDAHGRRFAPAGAEVFETRNPATGDLLAEVAQGSAADVDAAVAAARAAFPAWAAMPGHRRARILYAMARLLQKHARTLAVLETLDTGKPIRESRDADLPLAARHFYYHAGMAQLMAEELPDRQAIGVCGQIIPWNFPLLMLAWKVAPALAMGNTVVLKPAEWTPLTALYFAQIAAEAGLPEGVLTILTGDGTTGAALAAHPGVDKVAFTGSTEVGRAIRRATAGQGKALTLELGGKSAFILAEDADLDSAIEGLVESIWFNGGQVCCAGSRLIVQEGIAGEVHDRLRARMATLRVGDPLDKSIDLGSLADPAHHARVAAMIAGTAGEVFAPPCVLPEGGAHMAPVLISGLEPADPLMQQEIFGPVLVSTTYRTPAEAVAIANATRYGLAASVWSESLGAALDMAAGLEAGVIWVNGANMFDAAAGFGGLRESGFGREGGWEGLRAYTRPKQEAPALAAGAPVAKPQAARAPDLDRTAKFRIGGKQARPDGGQSRAVWATDGRLLGHAGIGSRKDIRNAVEAARAARPGWEKAGGALRAQVLYFLAENLSARAGEFAAGLVAQTGAPAAEAAAEVEAALERLFTWAAWADKQDGAVKPVPGKVVAAMLHRPAGVIGMALPEAPVLLGLVSVLAPALATGNACVVLAAESAPLIAAEFGQVLDTSDVPGGVVNMISGDPAVLMPEMARHADLEAVWCFCGQDLSGPVEEGAAGNLKRSWCPRGMDWSRANAAEFLAAATETRTLWLPYGA